MKNDTIYLWIIMGVAVWIIIAYLFIKYKWKSLLDILNESWQFIKPVKRWQKIVMPFIVLFIIVIFLSYFVAFIEAKGFFKGVIYLIAGIMLWITISIFYIRLFQKEWKLAELTKLEVSQDHFIGILFMTFLIFGPLIDIIFNGVAPKGNLWGISTLKIYKICALSFLIFIAVFHLIYEYLWLKYPEEMISVYRKMHKLDSEKELYSRVKLLLWIVLWNTFYLGIEFIFLVVFFETENNVLTPQYIFTKFFKIVSEIIGVNSVPKAENSNWMIIFEGWAKVVYLVIIGAFILNYLFTRTEERKN
ncbi:hypothetical protein [Anaerocellum diazotrophicum]|uniref:Uncharacterized protein n=1 Tax=Caldicellulosiruptor diazotrophicus TaxID=2806205 RepID=A0ABM7NJ28_9FIRM|nr:hypothetical protein [Caldicellulosiruptor diazotrophicus]BCS80103.1 hypothetical protein CaldiYA01_00630 [Caldicellulosiruptor diazotrophicus]